MKQSFNLSLFCNSNVQESDKYSFKLLFLVVLASSSSSKMLSYRRETALQGTLVLAKSGRLKL